MIRVNPALCQSRFCPPEPYEREHDCPECGEKLVVSVGDEYICLACLTEYEQEHLDEIFNQLIEDDRDQAPWWLEVGVDV
jgi:hypothetical protein